jgi:hypothetical protein
MSGFDKVLGLQGGASERRLILSNKQVIKKLITDIVRNTLRLSSRENEIGCMCRTHGEDETCLQIWA